MDGISDIPRSFLSPRVSIVMGAYNSESYLEKTIRSILDQTFTDFELIIIDDGSNDLTADILNKYSAKDSRIRVYQQKNQGLTRALIRGCSLANGEFIARQDAGDFSLQERLEKQVEILSKDKTAVMVASGVEFLTQDGHSLMKNASPGLNLDAGLRNLSLSTIKGPPHHGGTMFRRDSYVECGGYRHQFRVAQDMDLWLRLSELGTCMGCEDIMYQALIEPGSISFNNGPAQRYFGGVAIESARLRRNNQDDDELLDNIRPPKKASNEKSKAGYYYFLAVMLQNSDNESARKYFECAIKHNPLHLKSHFRKLLLTRKRVIRQLS